MIIFSNKFYNVIMPKLRKLNNLEATPPPRKMRAVTLRRPIHVQKFLAKLINEFRRGDIDGNDATKQAYIAGLLLKSFETVSLEERIDHLERKISDAEE